MYVYFGQVILSVMWAGGFLGLSYYEVESAYLFFMPSVAEAHDFELLSRGSAYILCLEDMSVFPFDSIL